MKYLDIDRCGISGTTHINCHVANSISFHFRLYGCFSLLKLNEDGLVNKLLNSWKVIRPECYASTEFIPLGMEQSLPALIFLLVGILTSFLILGVEVVLFEKKSD